MPASTLMDKLSFNSIEFGRRFCAGRVLRLQWLLWPEAEDRALRGRNLSAVFRTLYRQERNLLKSFLSCAQPWRVENQSDKSTLRKSIAQPLIKTTKKLSFSPSLNYQLNSPIVCPFFRGKSTEIVRIAQKRFELVRAGSDFSGWHLSRF